MRIIVGSAAGSAPDILARLIAEWLSGRLGQPFVVENRPGAGGNVATEAVVKAVADGHTLLLATLADAVNATLYSDPHYNFVRDIAPVASISRDPNVMVVNPSFPSKTVPKFITYAKTHPGQLTMASRGVGTSPHLAGELFKFMTGINMVHVAYRGSGPALTDLLGGHVQVYFAPISASIEYIRAGQLRALAVTSAGRAEALPDIPTAGNFETGYEDSALLMLTVSFSCCDQNLPSRPQAGCNETLIPADGPKPILGGLTGHETRTWMRTPQVASLKVEPRAARPESFRTWD